MELAFVCNDTLEGIPYSIVASVKAAAFDHLILYCVSISDLEVVSRCKVITRAGT